MKFQKCPGQDKRCWKPEDVYELACPNCGNKVEFFKDDSRQTCKKCGFEFRNPKFDLGCAKWCKFAKECLGADYFTEEIKETLNQGENKMNKIKRKIIKIDEEKCTGCALCIPSCPEQAIQIVNGKAKVVKELYCDGLGACLGACPEGALTIEERVAEAYNDEATITRIKEVAPEMLETHIKHIKEHTTDNHEHHEHKGSSCPGSQAMIWKTEKKDSEKQSVKSELSQWPIQLHLVSPLAPYFQNADLIITADCVPFAYGNFHQDFLQNKAIVIACPKLDDVEEYVNKLSRIFSMSNPKSIEVIHMEVPCCFGLMKIVQDALNSSGKKIPIKETVIGIKGGIVS